MGSDLYRMIRDGAPATWTGPMVHVAQAIADDARDPRQGTTADGGWPWSAIPIQGDWDSRGKKWRPGLTERTGMSARAISRALADLAAAGYEMREAIGTGKDGRVVFTAPGRAVRFRVPPLPPRPTPASPSSTAASAAERSPSTASEGPAERSPDSAERSPRTARTLAKDGDPIPPGSPHIPPALVDPLSPADVEGARARDQKINDHDSSGDGGAGTCPECDQQAALMRTMRDGLVLRNHSRGRDGEQFCPGTGQPPAARQRKAQP